MNKRMVIMFLFTGTMLFSATVKAQKLVFVFANGMYNKPTGDFKNAGYNYGFGGEAGAGVGLMSSTFVTGSVGYNSFNNTVSGVSNLKATPVKFGFRQYLFSKILFAKLDAGVASVKFDGGSGSKFTGGIGAGVKLAGLNLGIDYNTINLNEGGQKWIGWLAFKAGFSFGL